MLSETMLRRLTETDAAVRFCATKSASLIWHDNGSVTFLADGRRVTGSNFMNAVKLFVCTEENL